MKRTLRLLAVAMLLPLAGALAQNAPAPKPAAPAAPATKSVTLAAPTAAERNIRFQFDGIPYAEVVERFAQMANRPLVADVKIEGTLTFNDPKPYNYAEALDTLNVILSMKSVMLIEDGNYLKIVPFKELQQLPLRILRGKEQGTDVRPGEVVTVVVELKALDARDVSQSITNLLSSAGSVATLSRGRGLILTDRMVNIQRIRALISAVDAESVAERQMKTFTLLHASGAVVADLINRTFGVATAPRRTNFNPQTKLMETLPADPGDYVTAVYDDASRTLVLFGPRERLELADQLVSRFEDKEGGAGDVRIYTPQLMKADDLVAMIRQAIPGVAGERETAAAAATKARVIADTATGRIIVAAPLAGQADQIEQLINRLDKPVHGAGGVRPRGDVVQVTKIFRTRTAEATNVANILREAFTRRAPSGATVTTASVTVEPKSQSVIITGTPAEIQTATDIISQLETGSSTPRPQQTRFIDLGSPSESKRLLPLIEQIYRGQATDSLTGSVAHARILPEPETGRLIVTGSEEHLKMIEDIVKELRVEKSRPMQRKLQIITFKSAKLDSAFTSLNSLITERMADKRFEEQPKPSVIQDSANNRVLVTATDEQFREIEQIVAVVDVAPEQQRREMAVVPVRSKSPTEIITLATQLMAQLGDPGSPQTEPKLLPDASGKQIIVLATAKDMTRVREFIQQLDVATTQNISRQFKSVEMNSRSAADLVTLVTQLYTEQLKGQNDPPGGAATLFADAKNNRIMVSGAELEIARVEAIIRQLDPAGRKAAREETRVVRLKAALAAELATLVEKSLSAQGQQVKVLVDARSNSLVLSGDADAVEAASKIILQLDTSSDVQPREMRVMELKQGDATVIAALATPLVTELLKSQRGPEYTPTIKIVPDAAGNRLILSGPRNELLALNTIIDQLDQAPEGAGGAKVIKLNNALATKIVGVVSNAMLRFDARNQPIRRVTVTADAESNTLVVSGSRTDLKEAESIISKLDNEGLDLTQLDKPRQFKLIEVRSNDPDGLAAIATRIFTAQTPGRAITNLVSISAEPNGKRIIVLAPDAMLAQIEAVIATLDSKPDQTQRELGAIELKNARAADLLPTVTRIYTEQTVGRAGKAASLYADASGARIMVFGTQDQVAAVRQIVTSLEEQAPAVREVKVFDLGRLTEATRVLPLLKQLYADKFANSPAAGAADAQMISDGKTGRIVVSARADHLKVIEELIAGLQPTAAAPVARETKSFEVGNAADVQRLQPLVQQLYTDQWRERGESDPADAQILSDTVRGRLIVTGRPEHLKQIEAILAQLGAANVKPLGSSARDTRIFDLTTASAIELAVTVKTLYTEQSKARFGNIAPDTLITADAGGNRLIVVGDTNELAVIEGIVQKLDKTSAQSATARVFRIKSADPAKVAEILTTALVRYDALGRPQKRVTVTADAKTRTLVVTGDPKELQGISLIIEQLDSSLAEQSERKMKVLTLKQGAVRDITMKLRQLFADRVKSQPELGTSELLMLDDSTSNQLILAGSDAQLKAAELILSTLQESVAATPTRELKMFELGQPAEVRRVALLAQQLYQEKWKDRDAADPADAQFLSDTNNARLMVSARPLHLKEIEAIVAMVRSPAPDPATLETRVFDLVAASAGELGTNAKAIYLEQLRTRPSPPAVPAMILPDLSANRIVLSGVSNELDAVEAIIKKLDKANAVAVAGGTRIFKLTNAEPEQVAIVLSTALARVTPVGRTIPRVTVGADNRTRLLTVVGEPRDIAEAAKIIEELEANTKVEAREMRIFSLPPGMAENTTRNIRQIVFDQLKSRGYAADANVIVLADERNPRLLVTATDAQLKVVEAALRQVENMPELSGRQLSIITLTNVVASPIVQVVTQLFATQLTNRDAGQRLVVTASPDDRTLLVDGPGHTLTRIAQLVRTLDLPQTNSATVIQTVHLKKAEAVALAEAVTKTIASREAQPQLKRVTVTPVTSANALLLNGPTDSVQEVMKIVRELDSDSVGGDVEVRVYKLKSSDAKEVLPVLEQMIEASLDRRGGRRTPAADDGTSAPRRSRANIAVLQRSNSLIVSGTAAQFKLIEQLLPTLDAAPEQSDRDVHIAWLKKAKAEDVASKLTAVYADRPAGEKPVIEADYQANSITVIAKRGEVAAIQDLINRLDDTSGKDDSLQVRLRPLGRIPVDQMARMLTNIYPQMHTGQIRIVEKLSPLPLLPRRVPGTNTTSAITNAPGEVVIALDRDANAIIFSGPTAELDNIDRILNELQFSGLAGDAELHVFALKEADPVIVARTLNDLFRAESQVRHVEPLRPGEAARAAAAAAVIPPPKMVVVPEPRTRSIIVRAKATDFLLMKSLIEQLDAAGLTSQLDFRLIALTNAPAEKIAPLVQQMAQQLNLVRPGESLTVTPYPRLKSLLVFARGPMIEQLEKLVRALDQPTEHGEAEVRVFTLQKANAPQLAAVLLNMLRPGATNDLTPEARELQEQVRRLKVTNTNGVAVTLDLTKPIKIMADPGTAGQNGGNRLLISSSPDNLLALAAVVEMLDKVALTDAADVAIIALQHADATAVSQTLTSVFTQGVRLGAGPAGVAQPEGEQGKALVSPFNVAVDARLNTMILSGRKESLALARRIIEDLDKPIGRFLTEVKLFRLKHASATRLLPLLQAVFAEGAPVAGSEGISTFVTRLRTTMENGRPVTTEQAKARAALVMQADDTMNVLIVAARTDALPLIEEVIKQLDIPDASGLSRVRIYPLQHADAATVQKIINDLHTGARPGSVRNEDKPTITVDDRSNSMVVSGNEKAFAMIDGLLIQLDKALPLELRDIRILPLTSADATELAGTLQKLMDARIARQGTAGKGQAEALRVLIVPESRSNSLLIGGGKDSFELVQSLVRQLDTAAPALSGRIRLVPLQFADARVVATTLNNLFTQRYAAAKSPDTQRAKPVIIPDARINGLLVSAAVADNEMIDDLMKKLDRRLENPALTLSILPLKHNDAAKVATTLESIFAARLKARALPGAEASASEQVKIETDSLNNSLIVSANKENLELITEMLTRLDVEPTVASGVMETFVLKFADAQRVATMLRGLVQQGLYRPGRPLIGGPTPAASREALAISVDPRSNTLFISASPENLAIVKEIVTKLDTKELVDASSMKIYRLEHARAANLATVLTQFFTAKRAGDAVAQNGPDRSIPVAVIADARINALLVTGGKEAFDILDRVVPQLDGEDVQARQNFRVFQLKQATAVKLQDTLTKLFANRPPRVKGEAPDPITVIADAWVNGLIVGAVVEDMATVESLINRLDSEQAQLGLTVQVIPLHKADARRVATTVQSLYREGSQTTGALPITVSADERVNALVVSAGEADLKRIRAVVEKLDTDQVARVSEIRVMPLKYARAETLSLVLNTALNTKPTPLTEQNPNAQSVLQFITRTEDGRELVTAALKEAVLITPDPRMNSLIVSGPVDYMGLLEQVISRLDNSSPREAKIRVFTLKHANAAQSAQLLMSMFRMTPAGATAGTNVRTIQYTLMKPTSFGDQEVASAILGSEEQSALTVSVDPRTNSLLVGGTDHYLELVAEMIATLDTGEAIDRKTELYRLKNSQASDVALAVRTFLDQERLRVTQVLGADAVANASRMLDREVSIVAETNSNTILLSASPRFFDSVRSLVTELDQSQPQGLIQVMLAEIALDNAKDLGISWSYNKGLGGGRTVGMGSDFAGVPPAALTTFGGYSGLLTGRDLNFLVKAMEDDGRLEVLSRPQVLTSDNRPAIINIGQRIPLITDSRVTERGDTINSFRYENVGVNLQVTPRIAPDGFVKLEVGTTNSSLSSSTVEINKNATVPIINERRASTTVTVPDGQTVVIGGLISSSDDIRRKKIPLLGDIPYVGILFRSSKKKTERRELLIMLTPQVLGGGDDEAARTALDGVMRKQLDRSQIKDIQKPDALQKSLLEPLFPPAKPGKGELEP